jgi:hypothetical protein
MKGMIAVFACAAWLMAAAPAQAQAQGQGGVPGGRPPDAIDHAKGLATRPYPTLPAPSAPAQVYVPERRVFSPQLRREVIVPGHWERRVSDQRMEAPPLTVVDPRTGATVIVPGGERLPADRRQGP